MAREINLVPDIKGEMIKTLKLRNYIFFACIVVAAASVVVTLLFGTIAGGQSLAMNSKKEAIDKLSAKINSYTDLTDFLTIKDQLSSISSLNSNKQVLSRTFDILSAMRPTGADTITISELSVNLSEAEPTFVFDAQANAGKEPYIDYNVLDSFKKSMQYLHYDYGDYVDKENNIIPSYCMIEKGEDGALLNEEGKGNFAYWIINGKGCNPSNNLKDSDYELEEYKGRKVVKIWRTPQYSDWYKENASSDKPYMSLDGAISNVPHFNSDCISYKGEKGADGTIKWDDTDNKCSLVPNGAEGIIITESSNGRGADNDDLVLRFSAVVTLNPEAFKFSNHHMIALPPSGHHNVTDSYVQVQAMFGERAADCAEGDTACNTNKANEGK
ncbi:hypothetical protein IKF28_03585 [Candidatus Saccharibacteria bacterium]|nr:hypothetical protein [Candidatus Saccharibacteria bacterium]